MPPLPRGLVKRKVKTTRGTSVVYYWRQELEGRDQRISLGDDYSIALARFRELQKKPPAPGAASPLPSPPLTLEVFSRRWLSEYAASQRTSRGRAQAEQRFKDYLWPALGTIPLSDLTAADIRRLSAELATPTRERPAGVGLVTRRRLLEDLRCCLYYAQDEAHVLERSPWVKGKRGRAGLLPELPEVAPDSLNDLEVAEVLRAAPAKLWRPALQLLLHTGLRWGELRALTWKDVREAPYLHLLVTKQHTGGPTKTRKFREVPLGVEAREVLESLPDRSGNVVEIPETASWIRRFIRRHSRVSDFHVHRLRHTFACRYLERGGRIETLQRILGHSSVRQTEQYAKLRPEIVAAEMARIDGTVAGTVPVLEGVKARN